MSNLVSIMIPAYNQPGFIEQAVQSALAQDYDNLEVIVSDDSTDRQTEQILKQYYRDKRFSYFKSSTRLGRVANYRKLLFELAKGDWVMMLDGDDYYIDNKYISRAMEVIKQNPELVLAGAGTRVVNEITGIVKEEQLVDTDIIFDGKEVFTKRLNLPNHQTDLYKSSLARELDFYRSPSTGSDSESLFRLCLRGKIAYLHGLAAVWRIHGQNTTFNRDMHSQISELKFIDAVYQDALLFLNRKDAAEWRRHIYRGMTIHLLSESFKANNYAAASKILLYFGRFLGPRLTLSYSLRLVRQFQKSMTGKKAIPNAG